jgi:hypothetical protein
MKLSDIHAALGRGDILPGEQAVAPRLAIEAFALRVGLPVFLLDYTPPDLARALPPRPPGPGNPAVYFRWRKTLLDVQMRACPGDVDGDPWVSLARALRIEGRESDVSLRALERALPGVPPSAITDDLLRRAEADVAEDEKARVTLRSAVNALRRAFDSPLAQAAGLLPAIRPAPLPPLRDHAARAPMAPAIAALHAASDHETRCAIAYVNAVAVAAGLCDGASDTLAELGAASLRLPDPAAVGMPPVRYLRGYVNAVCAALAAAGVDDPRLSPVEASWDRLRRAGKRAGCETNLMWAIAKEASRRELRPADITPERAREIVEGYGNSSMRSKARHGCEQIDALRGQVPDEMLPPQPTGIHRARRRPKPPHPAPPPAKTAWTALYAELRRLGATRPQIGALSLLRRRAEAKGKAPENLSQAWIDGLATAADKAGRARLREAIRVWNIHAPHADGMPVQFNPLADARRSHGPLPQPLRAELADVVEMFGAAPSSRRALRSALGALYAALTTDLPAKIPLEALLDAWHPDVGLSPTQNGLIGALKADLALPWTDGWRDLQRAVAASGLPRKRTPVPALLAHAGPDGLEPWQLTCAWAQGIDRRLRSSRHHPPHGRADLARTFARNLGALDSLHDRTGFRRGDLLPPRIGPIRS